MKTPALKIYRAALQYAQSNGMPFFTMREQMKAVRNYINWQTSKN